MKKNKKLQILVPQYKESEIILSKLLDSIELQQNINMKDIGVIIVNDGSDIILNDLFFKKYSFDIDYFLNKHEGVSGTRNKCLDRATADYVMFCDADDMFFNMCGLWMIFREIDNGYFDCLTSIFLEESHINNGVTYLKKEKDSTFVHGKVYRRKFLIDNKIRWNNKLTIHEDSFFNILCLKLSKELRYIENPFYLWKWRDDSVCRKDPKYMLKTYPNLLDSSEALVDEFIKRDKLDFAKTYLTNMFFKTYFDMNKREWNLKENELYKKITEKRFSEYYLKFKKLYDATSIKVKSEIIKRLKNKMFDEGLLMEGVTLNNWLNHIEKLGCKTE